MKSLTVSEIFKKMFLQIKSIKKNRFEEKKTPLPSTFLKTPPSLPLIYHDCQFWQREPDKMHLINQILLLINIYLIITKIKIY